MLGSVRGGDVGRGDVGRVGGGGVLDASAVGRACASEGKERGHTDWRLPSAKELHSILDYTRSPEVTGSAAIDALFDATTVTDEAGQPNFGWYWTSTSHLDGPVPEANAVYVAFGEALGFTKGLTTGDNLFLDVHGAGAQRSDPKVGAPEDFPQWGKGPQGDVRRVWNLARCVRTL